MSLSVALIPQQRPQCHRRNAQIFARVFDQHYGNWSYMKSRSICRNPTVVEQQLQGFVRCSNQAVRPIVQQRTSSILALHRQQMLSPHREDFRVYPQSVDLDAFFGEEQKCDRVSDVCLLNDHFILVKMPQPEQTEQPEQTLPSAQPSRKLGARLPRCFKCSNRSNRISPIQEQVEEPEPVGYKPWSQHDDDVEVFSSTTRIIPAQSQQQIGATSLSAHTAGQDLTLVKQPLPTHRLQLEALQAAQPPSPSPPPPENGRGPLHWILWPFRWRLSRRAKPQRAAVHKTYFISWHKPPDTLWHGYGVERVAIDRAVLRRCRSAIF